VQRKREYEIMRSHPDSRMHMGIRDIMMTVAVGSFVGKCQDQKKILNSREAKRASVPVKKSSDKLGKSAARPSGQQKRSSAALP